MAPFNDSETKIFTHLMKYWSLCIRLSDIHKAFRELWYEENKKEREWVSEENYLSSSLCVCVTSDVWWRRKCLFARLVRFEFMLQTLRENQHKRWVNMRCCSSTDIDDVERKKCEKTFHCVNFCRWQKMLSSYKNKAEGKREIAVVRQKKTSIDKNWLKVLASKKINREKKNSCWLW